MANIIPSTTMPGNPTSTAASGPRAAHQAGILEGSNPSKYDSKNPIIIFIIQVCSLFESIQRPSKPTCLSTPGWHHHYLLPHPPLPPFQDSATQSHCRDHWRYSAGSFGIRSHPRLYRCHIPFRFHTYPLARRQSGPGTLPILGRFGGRHALAGIELEDSAECGSCGYGSSLWFGMCDCIRSLSYISRRIRIGADQLWHLYAVRWRGHGHHCKC